MQSMTSRLGALLRALGLLGVIAVAAPSTLVWAARSRFGGPAPWSGVSPIGGWDTGTIWTALTDRLSESTVADIVVRISLMLAWTAIAVLLATVVVELVHMVRHDGLAMPDLRGLGLSQSVARVIAAGLLVVPFFGSSSRAIANDAMLAAPIERWGIEFDAHGARPEQTWLGDSRADASSGDAAAICCGSVSGRSGARAAGTPAATSPSRRAEVGRYVVQSGDSIWSIATRMAGPDPTAIDAYADDLLDLNLGRQMDDGRRFSNAALIDVGWVLQLPAASGASLEPPDDVEIVDAGETLWSIAEDELGDGARWPEIFEANEGRIFDDGRRFTDPDLIQPGWELALGHTTGLPAAERAGDGPDAAAAEEATEAFDPGSTLGSTVAVESADAGSTTSDPGDGASRTLRPQGDAAASPDPVSPRPSNAWVDDAGDATERRVEVRPVDEPGPVSSGPVARPADSSATPTEAAGSTSADEGAVELLTYERAAMLSGGVLALLAVRRRNRMRRARPNTRLSEPPASVVAVERALRSVDPGDRFARVDVAIRHAALPLVDHGVRVGAVLVAADGALELIATAPARLPPPWIACGDGDDLSERWLLAAATPIELLVDEARRVGSPCPTLVQLGRDDRERDVYVDLEALGAIEVGGPGDRADAIVAAIAATLAASVLAEVTTLVGVGVADGAFLNHRHYRAVRDPQRAFEIATGAIGSTARAARSTFELRARVTSGEAWEPAVVLAGSAAGTVTPPRERTGLAIVSAAPVLGPSSRLAPDGGAWSLLPMGVRLTPIGLSPDDVVAIGELAAVPDPVPAVVESATSAPRRPAAASDSDATLVGTESDVGVPAPAGLAHRFVVRLLGPVVIESADGRPVEFERSKTRELIAWLATHRDRATRSNARAALWELDVRDATFANVVSEARRALARCVEPPEGEEWVGRTMTDALPLHELVVTDADLLARSLESARLQPPDLAIATLAPAVESIVGMPFEGTSYLWPDAEGIASDLVLRALTACEALAQHYLSIGDIDGVFAASGRGLQVLPAHEDMVAIRMRAHAQMGDRAGLRHEWERYERAITADPWSDGEPSDRMLELRRDLLSS